MKYRALIVDDDRDILNLLKDTLSDAGLEVEAAQTPDEFEVLLDYGNYDIVVLDIMMQGKSGFELCREIRGRFTGPIIFLSAKDTAEDIVKGLSLGADDYLTKPFSVEELTARILAHLRRESRSIASQPEPDVLAVGEITADIAGRRAYFGKNPVELSTREYELLVYLMRHEGRTISKDTLFRDVWHTQYGDMGTIAINIKNLREKIDPERTYIQTVWGSGYRMVAPTDTQEEK